MRQILSAFLVFLLAASLIGCSAQQSYDRMPATTTTAGYSPGSGRETSPPAENEDSQERKIIRNASLDLEVPDVVTAYQDLLNWAAQYGGYEARRNQQKSNGFITIDAQIKINPEYLDDFLAYAAELGEVINTQISTEDITDSYYDTQTRLRSMELSLERYYDYLDQARTIEESLSVQNEINRLTVEIEALKGRLKLWDNLMAESTITLRLRQTSDPVKLKKDIDWSTLSLADMGYLMRSGLARVANVLVSFVQWTAIVVVAAAPFWIIALIVVLVIRHKKKKRQKLIAEQQAQIAANRPDQPPQA